jgi:hypothetical protein
MFIDYTLNKNTKKCICCDNTPRLNIEIGYHHLPFRYVKYIETHIFHVNMCHYCYLHSKHDNKIFNKIIKNTSELLDIILR